MLLNVSIFCRLVTLLLGLLMQLVGQVYQFWVRCCKQRLRRWVMRFKLVAWPGPLWIWSIMHGAWEVKTIIPGIDSTDEIMDGLLGLVRLGVFLGQLGPLSFIMDGFHRAISADFDESLADEVLESMHCIMGHGIVVSFGGVFPLQLIIPGQFRCHLSLVQFFHLLLGLDFLLGSSSLGTNLKCK